MHLVAHVHMHAVSKVASRSAGSYPLPGICEWTEDLDEHVLSLGIKPAWDQRDMQVVNHEAYITTPTIA